MRHHIFPRRRYRRPRVVKLALHAAYRFGQVHALAGNHNRAWPRVQPQPREQLQLIPARSGIVRELRGHQRLAARVKQRLQVRAPYVEQRVGVYEQLIIGQRDAKIAAVNHPPIQQRLVIGVLD